jgi:hypothetical protein
MRQLIAHFVRGSVCVVAATLCEPRSRSRERSDRLGGDLGGTMRQLIAHFVRGSVCVEAATPYQPRSRSRERSDRLGGHLGGTTRQLIAHFVHGLRLWRLGKLPEAQQVFERILSLNPNDNQGVRWSWHEVRHRRSWEEMRRNESAERFSLT